ncbi:MAG TPA: COX15/CtaA family protein [Solirubrobacterales bacterium]|nr:COX15/CtaA family protein [Solirubrobacterales bacterium]
MHPVAPRGEADDARRYRRLVSATIVATFGLIVIGGIVRVSDSGLGCGPAGSGTHGWPLCEGGVIPPATAESLIEFSHRVAAGIVALMVLGLIWIAVRRLRERTWIVRGSIAAGVLVVVQALLGGLTVERGLEDELVAAHLGLAMLLIGLLIVLRRRTDPEPVAAGPASEPARPGAGRLRTLAVVASALLLATIVAGGYVAGTERMGTPEAPIAGAHMACGGEFPTCLGSFMPFGTSHLVDIHLMHRLFMYLASIAVIAMVAVALVQGGRSRAFPLAGALLVAQIALGAANVWAGVDAGWILAHLIVGTLLWSTAVYATATLVPAPEPTRSPAPRRRPSTETAAA